MPCYKENRASSGMGKTVFPVLLDNVPINDDFELLLCTGQDMFFLMNGTGTVQLRVTVILSLIVRSSNDVIPQL